MKTKILALGAAKELWVAYKISLKVKILEGIQREVENLLQIIKHTVGEEEFLTPTLNPNIGQFPDFTMFYILLNWGGYYQLFNTKIQRHTFIYNKTIIKGKFQ